SLGACASEPPLRCRFGEGHTLGAVHLAYDDVRLVAEGAGWRALWSAPDGLFARPIDGAGAPTGPTRRLGARCDGGLDAAALGAGALLVACARRGDATKGRPGALVLLRFEEGVTTWRRRFDPVGRDARGVAMAVRGDRVGLAWHDGVPGSWQLWFVEVALGSAPEDAGAEAEDAPRPLSSSGVSAGAPRVWVDGERALWTWAETWLEAGYPHGQVLVWSGRGLPQRVAEVDFEAPAPDLARDGRSLVVFFRDHRRPWRRPQLYARRVDDGLRPMAPAERVGRANHRRGAVAFPCAGGLAAVIPRTWDEDVLVGLQVLDGQLEGRIREQQIYEWAARFPVADGACVGDGAILALVGAEGRPEATRAPLHAMALRCE
ncbi:MAG TPA: hypothetical protein RMH26_31485, partial [Polyangiaceae bacterium LLY-WYZ-15_(1-7)]|nr:hypothetical protein [Polyangiaceae bacterium LLY-WYZ-15_(1-7)]